MEFFVTAFLIVLHTLFFGAGLAWWIMPRPWQRWWPVLAPLAGWTLQSLAVWLGTYAGGHGTNSYAWASELVPAALLAGAIWRARGRLVGDVVRLRWLWLAMLVVGALLVWPMVRVTRDGPLTTVALGSCDAADYAAGARVFQEFAHGDRGGMLGQTEVVNVASADNFYDFWLRLNHFTPSALMAHHASILGRQPHELVGLVTLSILILSLPMVFWLARAGLRLSAGWALGVALVYGLSPLSWYAVWQVAPGQLLAAQGIAALTWAGVVWWRGRVDTRRGLAWAGVLATAYGLLLGSYNFILLVCLAPAVMYAGGVTLRSGQWRRLAGWGVGMLAPLALAAVIFWERTVGLVERFLLFAQYDFGWRIPALTPEGWLGFVSTAGLEPLHGWGRWVALALVLGWWGAACVWAWRRRPAQAWLAASLLVPMAVGYFYLQWRGLTLGTNASYDAYKLLCVFFPGVLAALALGATLPRQWQRVSLVLGLAVFVGQGLSVDRFWAQVKAAPQIVTAELAGLQTVERDEAVASINMLLPDFWERLWADAFLLRKPQYFATHTYEGRLPTALRGEWDLNGRLLQIRLPDAADYREINSDFSLVRVASRHAIRARLGAGWYDTESLARKRTMWRWASPGAELVVENPHAWPLRIDARLHGRSRVAGDVQVCVGEQPVQVLHFVPEYTWQTLAPVVIPPGGATLRFQPVVPLAPIPGDGRALMFAAYGIELRVLADETAAPAQP